jgi:thiamine pyrophosphate-dependent acetolactate synthase large subunit-like protein
MKRIEALQAVAAHVTDLPIVVTCAATSRELAAVADRDNHLYLLDSMGLAPSVGTGLALALEGTSIERVLVLEGDGALFMNLNAVATMGYHRPRQLIVALLDNRSYASTGGQATYSESLDLGAIARSCGINTIEAGDVDGLVDALDRCRRDDGPHFIHIVIEPGNAPGTPLLLADPVVLAARFTAWLETAKGTS